MSIVKTIDNTLSIAQDNSDQRLRWVFLLTLLATFAEVLSVGTIIPLFNNIEEIVFFSLFEDFIDPLIVSVLFFVVIYAAKSFFVLWVISVQNKYAYDVQKHLSLRVFRQIINSDYEEITQYGDDYFNSIINIDVIYFRDTLLLVILLMTELSVLFSLFTVSLMLFPIITITVSTIFLTGFICFRFIFAPISRRFGKRRIAADFSKNLCLKSTLDSLDVIHTQNLGSFFHVTFNEAVEVSSTVGAQQGALNQAPRFMFETLAVTCLGIAYLVSRSNFGGASLTAELGDTSYLVIGAIAFRLLPSINRIAGALQGVNFGQQVVVELCSFFQSKSDTDINLDINRKRASLISLENIEVFECKKQLDGKQVLKGGYANFQRGKIYGILGESGSGKSAFIKVLLGLYSLDSGEIHVNHEVFSSRLIDLPEVIAFVPQHASVIQGSILDNILLGRDLVCSQLEQLMPLLDWTHNLSDGLKTVLGPKGTVLSGGQVQRLAIARAFYSNPDLIVLDESTSALDEMTQEKVMRYIESRSGSCITIFITHRTENLDFCDEIYHVDAGVICKHSKYDRT
jgi:ATP-binding cassette, subfamily B, bacterial PglK